MSVYVGLDVHRKRSQMAVVTEDAKVQLNANTVNGTAPILRLIGDLPSGTPVAFETASASAGWPTCSRTTASRRTLVRPLRCKAIASARPKNDKGRHCHHAGVDHGTWSSRRGNPHAYRFGACYDVWPSISSALQIGHYVCGAVIGGDHARLALIAVHAGRVTVFRWRRYVLLPDRAG